MYMEICIDHTSKNRKPPACCFPSSFFAFTYPKNLPNARAHIFFSTLPHVLKEPELQNGKVQVKRKWLLGLVLPSHFQEEVNRIDTFINSHEMCCGGSLKDSNRGAEVLSLIDLGASSETFQVASETVRTC